MRLTRMQAIERFGVTYELDPFDLTVHEMLGQSFSDETLASRYCASSPERAEELVDARARDKAMRTVENVAPLFEGSRNRFYLWCIRNGLARHAAFKHQKIEKAQRDLAEARRVLREGADVKIVWLPETLTLPAPIDVGAPVYVLKDLYLREGVRLETDEVTDWEVSEAMPPNATCYAKVRYFTKNGRNFTRDTEENAVEISSNVMGQRLFLDREAAEKAARESAEDAMTKLRPWLSSACEHA